MTPVIEARGITKRFPGVLANSHVDFALEEGEIHALLGENGAGKSTLMNVLYGLYFPDEGTILVNGQPIQFHDPHDAIHHGIGMVHQHFMLVPVMTVAENIMLGEEETIGNALVSAGLAVLVGGALAALLLAPPLNLTAVAFWVIVAGLFFALRALRVRSPFHGVLFGAAAGAILGTLFEVVLRLVSAAAPSLPLWPVIGAGVGLLANLYWMDKRTVARRIKELSADFGLEVDPSAYVRDLPVGSQQRVEIIKALYRDAKVLILDEPTAVLTPQEADDLFRVMRRLAERGVSIIFITHKLREVLAVADRITVLRRGEVVGTTTPAEATRESLARMMVGREVLLQVIKEEAKPGEVVLAVHDLQVDDDLHHRAVKGITFEVRAGEIVGIAGVQGNGQTELVEALTRLREIRSGQVNILGEEVTHQTPRRVTKLGSAHIPEDRQRHGLVLTYAVADNLILADYYRAPFSNGIILNEPHIADNATHLVSEFDIRTPSIQTSTGSLSGGNQQKVIVARELARQPKLLIANQPTRGLDVGSIEFIHNEIVSARGAGAGVLLVSAELDEVMSLSDRILVMYQGRIMAEMPAADATREGLGLLMAGVEAKSQPLPASV
jgi:simple sugar transport system ATP-binding protein